MPKEYPAGFEPSRGNVNTVFVEREFMEADPTRYVSVKTDLEELRSIPKRVRVTDHEVKKVYSDYEYLLEKQWKTPRPMEPEKQTIIRSPQSVKECVAEMREAMDISGQKKFVVGLDQEKNLSTLQFSMKIEDCFGRGKSFR